MAARHFYENSSLWEILVCFNIDMQIDRKKI
jgi:hypothetical protein